MNALDSFLRDHANVHLKDAVRAERNIDWLLDGLTDDQLRASPCDVNSLAWLLWHLSRVEDRCVSTVIFGRPQLLDDAWAARLNIDERGDGEGMPRDKADALSGLVSLGALLEYRASVCLRTRESVGSLWPDRWFEPLTERDLETATEVGGTEAPWLVGVSRESLLTWWAIHHSYHHLGQMALVRRLVLQTA